MRNIFRNTNSGFQNRNGFTLIELLIVVAIIAILAAIAIPNFLAAQVRAKVSRVKGELRTLATGLESYRTDNENYPPSREGINPDYYYWPYAHLLTTPVAYLTAIPFDPFNPRYGLSSDDRWRYYELWTEVDTGEIVDFLNNANSVQYVFWSWAPDLDSDDFVLNINTTYDPTNGTVSNGNIYRFGP